MKCQDYYNCILSTEKKKTDKLEKDAEERVTNLEDYLYVIKLENVRLGVPGKGD